jgi:sensory rhodopsin
MSPRLLQADDIASGTFLLGLVAMAAATVLLIMGTAWVSRRWKLPVALVGIVTLVATIHYLYADQIWLKTQQMPIIYRYVDWLVTVPIQVVALYFFIATVAPVSVGVFWRLLVASVAMVVARYIGDAALVYPTLGFLIGLVLWLYILGEVYFGKLSEVNAGSTSESVQTGFFWLRLIVTIGWALYPLCDFAARLGGGVDVGRLNVIYNLADFVNQIAFGLAILATAMKDSAYSR